MANKWTYSNDHGAGTVRSPAPPHDTREASAEEVTHPSSSGDREFEDDKVLLSHQKAKHFRCPHCPRRLNTAGGLAVHIDQVHKLGTDRIANAIAGRDSFDVEIYGMEGIPAEDLKEWKLKKASEAGVDETAGPQAGRDLNKPKIDKTVISLEELKRQLGIHKDLMEGKITPSQAAQLLAGITPVAQPVLPPV